MRLVEHLAAVPFFSMCCYCPLSFDTPPPLAVGVDLGSGIPFYMPIGLWFWMPYAALALALGLYLGVIQNEDEFCYCCYED